MGLRILGSTPVDSAPRGSGLLRPPHSEKFWSKPVSEAGLGVSTDLLPEHSRISLDRTASAGFIPKAGSDQTWRTAAAFRELLEII